MASNSTIKGITVVIGGETTDLKNALKDVQSSTYSLQSELKQINNDLKFNPESTTLLAQKQEVLKQAVEESRTALNKLQEVESQVEEQAKNGELSPEKYRAYQREVEKAKSKLENFESQLAETEKKANEVNTQSARTDLEKTGKSANEAGDGFTSFETKANKINLSEAKKELDEVKKSSSELKSTLTDTAEEAAAAGAAVASALTGAVVSADSEQQALNSLQAQTGLTASEMAKYKDVINNIYKSNFGESQEDIANVLAQIKQTTNETDPTKIQETAESLYTLCDTFGYDYTETLRAVNMLMEQFGLTGEEAFNLIAQGSQNGLNKNGDFLDTINEYSVHYKQLGYDAEEFINSLTNGTAAGTFSVDKLGDAMKEFGIRTKDTATSTAEGFALLGYSSGESAAEIAETKEKIAELEKNLEYAKLKQDAFTESTSELTRVQTADKIKEYTEELANQKDILKGLQCNTDGTKGSIVELQKKFAAGGESAREATDEVLTALLEMDDQVAQNQAGVDLFGTMWEDLGIDGVTALMNVDGAADEAGDTLEDIKDIKYDNVTADWETLGRTIQTDVINPVGEELFPVVEDLCSFVSKNTDKIIPTLKTIGSVAAGIWAGKKTSAVIQGVQSLYSAYKNLKTATDAAATAQGILNSTQKANVIGAIAGAVVTLVGTIWTWVEANNAAEESEDDLTEAQQAQKDKIDELKQANQEFHDSLVETATETSGEYDYYEKLWDELQSIVDKNGEVKDGYEERAKFITETLSEVTGKEIEWNGDVIESYEDLKTSIDDVLKSKRANALLSATEGSYEEAVSGLTSAEKNKASAYTAYQDAIEDYNEALNEINKYGEEGATIWEWSDYEKAKENFANAKEALLNAQEEYESYEEQIVEYNTIIQNYEDLSAAITSGSTEKIEKAINNLQNNLVSATNGTKTTLEKQVEDIQTYYKNLKKSYEDGVDGVEKSEVEKAKKLYEDAQAELAEFNDVYGTAAAIASGKISEICASQSTMRESFKTSTTATKDELEQQVYDMQNNYVLLKAALDEGTPGVTQAMVDSAKTWVSSAKQELDKLEPGATSSVNSAVSGAANTMSSEESKTKIKTSSQELVTTADMAMSGSYSVGHIRGTALGSGYGEGIRENETPGYNTVISFVNTLLKGFGTPYNDGWNLGLNFALGYIGGLGFNVTNGAVQAAGAALAKEAFDATQYEQQSASPSKKARKLGVNFGEGYTLGIEDETDNAIAAAQDMTRRSLGELESNPLSGLNTSFANIRSGAAASQSVSTVNNSPTVELKLMGNVIINNDADIDDFNRRVTEAMVAALQNESLIAR